MELWRRPRETETTSRRLVFLGGRSAARQTAGTQATAQARRRMKNLCGRRITVAEGPDCGAEKVFDGRLKLGSVRHGFDQR